MARPRKKPLVGYMEGYPKLAFYLGPPIEKLTFPVRSRSWKHGVIALNTSDLVVIVAIEKHTHRGYHDFTTGQYKFRTWRDTVLPPDIYFIVPLNAIAGNLIPITSIYNWKSGFNLLPIFETKHFQIIDNGKELITPTTEVPVL